MLRRDRIADRDDSLGDAHSVRIKPSPRGFLAGITLVIVALMLPLTTAAARAEGVVAAPGVAELSEDDDVGLFVVGNTLFAVYHEIGHALIDLLTLPVVGREEDAADGFAALMMIPEEPDPIGDELIIAVADGWRLESDLARNTTDQGPLWGEHALDEQRYYTIVCLMVGSDQEGFWDFALDSGMPVERIRRCAGDFDRMKAGWQRLLSQRSPKRNAALGAADHGRFALAFEKPAIGLEQAFSLARVGGLVEKAVAAMAERVVLPRDITVRFMNCGNPNGFWDGERGEVLICYELVDDFIAILEDTAAR
ncbi:MAG: DUF4344 domain-containing metallopeptidase [Geminicoccaceae bacterium]